MSNLPRMIKHEIQPIRPVSTFKVSTKDLIYRKMAQFGCYSAGGKTGTTYTGFTSTMVRHRDDATIYVFTAEKVRAKWDHKTAGKPVKIVDGKLHRQMNSTKIRSAHWNVRVYGFKLSDVKSVQQMSRTFRVVMK